MVPGISFCEIFYSLSFEPPYFTITYPQYPVSKHIDTDNASEDDNDEDGDGDDDDTVQMAQFPDRSAAPSPKIFRGSRSLLPPTPPKVSPHRPTRPPPKQRTTRIPDFIQLLYQIRYNDNRTICSPIQYRSRIILLVEIKKITVVPTMQHFVDVFYQTDLQARHAFYTSPDTNTLGVIIAIGPFWTYAEYHRADLRPSPSLSEKKDFTYDDRTPPPRRSVRKEYAPFTAHIQSTGYPSLCLETEQSKEGLFIVRNCLLQLNYPQVSNLYFSYRPA